MKQLRTNIFASAYVLLTLLLLGSCNINNIDSEADLTDNNTYPNIEEGIIPAKQDNVERKIEDRIKDITGYLSRIDSSENATGVELSDDLKAIRLKLLKIKNNLKVDSIEVDSATKQKLQMVDDELMQIGKEIDEMDYKAEKL